VRPEESERLVSANVRPDDGAARDRSQLEVLYAVSRRLAALHDTDEILALIVDEATRLLGVEGAGIRLLEGDDLVLSARTDSVAGVMARPRLRVGESLTGMVVATGQPVVIEDIVEDTRFDPAHKRAAIERGLHGFLGVPLRARDRLLGALNVYTQRRRRFTPDEISLLVALADQASLAIEQDRRARRLRTLARLNQMVSSSLDTDAMLRGIAESAEELMGATAVTFWIADEAAETLELRTASDARFAADFPIRVLPFGEGAVGWVARHRRPLELPDLLADERIVGREWYRAHGVGSGYLLPILLQDALMGVLVLLGPAPFRFGEDDRQLLDSFVAQVGVAIRNARLYEESERRGQRLATLVEVARRLTRGLDLLGVLATIAEAAGAVFKAEVGFRLRDGEDLVRIGATPGARAAMLRERIRVGESISGHVALTGEPVVTADARLDPRLVPEHRATTPGALMCVPIRVGARILGTLSIYRERGYRFDDDALSLAMSLADQAGIAIENARLYEEAKQSIRRLERATAELKEATLIAEEASRAKSQFLANMSHELRTPLNSILGFTKVLLNRLDGELTERQETYLRAVHSSSTHLLELINSVLDISRIEAGKLEVVPQPIDVRLLIEECLDASRSLARGKPLQLLNDVPDDLPALQADRTKVKQILLNLLSNAVKFTPEGHVLVRARPVADTLQLSVADTGIGIAEKDLQRAFEPFQRLASPGAREASGTGLGLAICKMFVELHGGRIWAESRAHLGATFHVSLPLAGPPPARPEP
jgi:signal transduction histidine kinase